VPEEASGLR